MSKTESKLLPIEWLAAQNISKGKLCLSTPVQSKDREAGIGVMEVNHPNQTRLILRTISDVGNRLTILSRS